MENVFLVEETFFDGEGDSKRIVKAFKDPVSAESFCINLLLEQKNAGTNNSSDWNVVEMEVEE